MEQKNISINKFIVLSTLLFPIYSFAQKLGVKPFIGIHYNTTKVSANENLLFIKGNNRFEPAIGVLLSYQLSPKWGIEAGILNTPIITSYSAYHPNTGKQIASFDNNASIRKWVLNGTYNLKALSHGNIKIISGIELRSKRTPIFGTRSEPSLFDTNYVTFRNTAPVPSQSYSNLFNILKGVHFGVGYELLLKKRVAVEFRLTTRYEFGLRNQLWIGYKDNNNVFTNYAMASRFSYNFIMLVNLSNLLGGKPSK